MATKFLDYTGLSYFCSKIKAWCNATFAAITHSHASNAINAMTGYSKPNNGSAIAISDNLNSALGKLEAKIDAINDSNYVHLNGDEIIADRKTFRQTGDVGQGYASSYTVFRNASFDRTSPATNTIYYNDLVFGDADNDINTYNASGRMGLMGCYTNTATGDSYFEIVSRYYKSGTSFENYLSYLKVGFQSDGTRYASAPSTPNTNVRNDDKDILTRDWVPRDTRIVHTTENEVISGIKTFDNSIYVKGNYACFYRTINNYTADQLPGTVDWIGGLIWQDKNGRYIASVEPCISPDYLDCHIFVNGCDSTGNFTSGVTISLKHTGGKEAFRPRYTNQMSLGDDNHRWLQLYAMTATIDVSDERLKNNVSIISEDVLNAWDDVNWIQFQFKDAIEKKGVEARLHTGLVAQHIIDVFSKHNLDENRYAFFCYDSWDTIPEKLDKDGNVLDKAIPAGDIYSIRYEEALCIEAAYQRRKNKILENRISELETQVQNMLQILESLKGA